LHISGPSGLSAPPSGGCGTRAGRVTFDGHRSGTRISRGERGDDDLQSTGKQRQFRKGRAKTGGRRRGTLSRATRAWKDFVSDLVSDPHQQQALVNAIRKHPERGSTRSYASSPSSPASNCVARRIAAPSNSNALSAATSTFGIAIRSPLSGPRALTISSHPSTAFLSESLGQDTSGTRSPKGVAPARGFA
jgi:hypothetical protein